MIKTIEYSEEKIRKVDLSKASNSKKKGKKKLYWIDFLDPSESDLRNLSKDYQLLTTDLKNATDKDVRSNLIQRNNYTLVLFKAISDDNKIATLGIFLTKNNIITIHKLGIKAISEIQTATLSEKSKAVVKEGVNALFNQIIEEIGRDYFKLFDEVDEELNKLEAKIFSKGKEDIMHKIFSVKKSTIYTRQALTANRETLNEVEKLFSSNPTEREYIHQLHSDMIQLIDENTLSRERLTGVVDSYLTKQSNDLNEVMKSFTVIASLILLPTLITGAYGMNLILPLGNNPQGFWILITIMIGAVILMFTFFKKKGWV